MKTRAISILIVIFLSLFTVFISCRDNKEKVYAAPFNYQSFKDSLKGDSLSTLPDSINLFDKGSFVPGVDSLDTLLVSLDTIMARIKRQDKLSPEERLAVAENMRMLDSFYKKRKTPGLDTCIENQCGLFAHVIKSRQILYLYISGEIKDSFPVSTGMKKFTTPNMTTHPAGPVFMKYTSRKFPGGNYKGLGNMPYAVFVRGGYAIHGTTPGNFSKLGHIASHGCIRLHPDNARVIYELVKIFGLSSTWVKVSDS